MYQDGFDILRNVQAGSDKSLHWHDMIGCMVRTTGMVISRQKTQQLVLEVRFPEIGEVKSRRIATQVLKIMGPHFVNATRIMQLQLRNSADAELISDVVELFPFPMLIINPQCEVKCINARAEALAERMETFFISADHVFHAVHLDRQNHLLGLIEQLSKGFRHNTETFTLSNSDCTSHITLSLTKLNKHAQRHLNSKVTHGNHGSRFAIVIQDTKESLKLSHQALWNTFGLTNAEAELASLLLVGFSVGKCAYQQKLAKQTLRNHLGSIMKKTHTNRQPQLVALLTRLALSTML